MWGWIGYTILDDFLDDEGKKKLLPLATLALRELTRIYTSKLDLDGFKEFFSQVMDKIDEANTWEVSNCRLDAELIIKSVQKKSQVSLPDFGDYMMLANRSLGHMLGPLAIMHMIGKGKESRMVRNWSGFFKHYLIARQLNDDAHDWERDLKYGQVNAVGVMLLEHITKKRVVIDTSDESDIWKGMELVFWKEVIDMVNEIIIRQVEKAERDLKKVSMLVSNSRQSKMLKNIKMIVEKTRKEKAEALDFINAYGSGNV